LQTIMTAIQASKCNVKQVGQQVKAAGHCIRYVSNKWRCEALADKMSVW
jgi:hypothetical protein